MIFTHEFSETTNQYETLCNVCLRSVGWMSRAELSELTARGVEVLCFECDGVMADLVPGQLLPEPEELIIITNKENQCSVIFWNADNTELVAAPVRFCGGPCLSSSPYLSHYEQNVQLEQPGAEKKGGKSETC